jgi:diguanylate cyclase (GGDEF)-like protein/PAS domain S-box-containing protein
MRVFLLILTAVSCGAFLAVVLLYCCRKSAFFQRWFSVRPSTPDSSQLLRRERALIDSVEDLIWLKDVQGRYINVNQAFLDNYKKSRGEIEGRTDRELFSPELAELYCTQDRRALAQGRPLRVEDKVLGGDGAVWYETVLTPIFDEGGNLAGLSGVSRNITLRKHDQLQLDEYHNRLTLATHAGKFGVWDWDVVEDKLVWDDQMYAIYGLQREDFAGAYQAWASTVLPDDLAKANAEVQAALKGEREFSTQFRVRWPDGSIHYLRSVAMVLRYAGGKPVRMIGMNWDVTEQNEAHNALALRERELEAIFENIPNMVFVKDAKTLRYVRFNKAGEQMLGLSREQLIDHNDADFFPRQQADFFVAQDRMVIERHTLADIAEQMVDTPNGSLILHTKKVCISDAQGQPRYLLGISEDITARKEVEQGQQRLLEIMDSATDLIALADTEGSLIYMNGAGRRMLGFDSDESIAGVKLRDMYAPDVGNHVMENLLPKADKHGNADFETRLRSRSGWIIPASQVIVAHRDEHGRVTHYSTIARDIREYKRLLEHYMLSDKVFTFTSEAIMISDARNRIISVNEAFTKLTGYTLAEVKGKDPALLASGKHDAAFYAAMWEAIDSNGHWEGEVWDRRKDGTFYPKWLNINAVKEIGRNRVSHYVGIFTDITQIKQQEDHILHLAFHDVLTGLPNRTLFQDRLLQAIAESKREDLPVAVMLLNLDNFKYVNDTLGHPIGDLLIKEVAGRLTSCVRESDTVARLGGDEFIIIINSVSDLRDLVAVAEKILSEMAKPMHMDGHRLRVTSSIGISLYPDDANNTEDLVRNADSAMYQAKNLGRDNFQFFTRQMNEAVNERVMIEEHLRRGLEHNEFELFYQAKIDTRLHKLVGCEALLRWRHPEWGVVMPTRFIPVAEDSGFILPLGEWVIAEACRQLRLWLDAGLELQVAINLSERQLRDMNLIGKIGNVLKVTGNKPGLIELEITESTLIEGASHASKTLHDLHAMGVPLAVDDFGTGYSSLAYLKTFDIDTLKIDKSFMDGISTNPDDAAIVRAVLSLAHQLGMKVVAEGVETIEQLRFLENLHCDMIQGYYFSKPLPPAEFLAYVTKEFPAAFADA